MGRLWTCSPHGPKAHAPLPTSATSCPYGVTRGIRRIGGRCGSTARNASNATCAHCGLSNTKQWPSLKGDKRTKNVRLLTTTSKGHLAFDQEAFDRAEQLAGVKGYVTNIPATLMSAGEVVGSHHELWHVEQAFRMSKHDLRARPMFHHERDSIDAHLTVVAASLAVAKHLQAQTGLSIKKIVRELRPLRHVTITLGGHTITAQPQTTDTARHILTTTGALAH